MTEWSTIKKLIWLKGSVLGGSGWPWILDKSLLRFYNGTNTRYSALGVDNWSDTATNGSITLAAGTYTFSYSGESAVNATSITVRDSSWAQVGIKYNEKYITFTLPSESAIAIYINFPGVVNWDNYTPQIDKG